jgi:hypothetical protein
MATSAYERWVGQKVCVTVRLLTGGTSGVPLRGIIVGESNGEVRFLIGGGWEIKVLEALILTVEQDKDPL